MKRLLFLGLVVVAVALHGIDTARAQLNKPYFFYKGRELILNGDYRTAIEMLNLLLRTETKEYEGYFLRGVAKYNLDDLLGAEADFSSTIAVNPVYTMAYQYRAMAGDDRILYAKLLPDLPDQGFLFPNRLAQGVFQTIRQGSAVAAEEKLEQFFRYVREHLYPNSHPSYVAVQLFNSTLQFLQELSIDARNIFPDLPGESARLLQFETLDAVEQYFHNLALRLLDYLYQQRTQPKERVSQIIRDFLDEHYADDGITLTLLAEELHFSSSYLAKAFKSDTDKSIKEYITCKRIEAAKELLRDKNAKVGDVARQVGYTNSRSFINIFKKYTGLTPGEYKEQL